MMRSRFSFLLAGCLVLSLVHCALAIGADVADVKSIEFFEKKIRPVLVEHCYQCHSAEARDKKKLRGGLLLDSKEAMQQGGDSGPALVPGKAKDSLLLKALHYSVDLKMPPKGKLPANVISDFESWINQGAPDSRTATATAKAKGMSLEEGRKFWAYRPARKSPIPTVKNTAWPCNDIDAFILARLEAANLKPAADADSRMLVRRIYYDLIGLPPTPEEVTAIEESAIRNPQSAIEELVDRLLASPHFGERWGRHWLDVARFAESMTLRGFVFKEAWRYRDYVIDSFNQDVPFDRFIQEQVAGDLLPSFSVAERRRQLIATTFLTLGNNNLEEQDKKQLRMDVVDEQLDAISRAFLAQTITCARCHDHKFDPIPTRDYYALAGILRNTRTLEHANVSQWLELPLPADPEQEELLKKQESGVAVLQEQIKALKGAIAKNAPPANPAKPTVVAIKDLPGVVVDDTQAKKVGEWKVSQYTGAYVGAGYIHDLDAGKGEKTVTFQPEIPQAGKYEVRLAYSPASNRADKVPVIIFSADGEKTVYVNQQQRPEIDGLFHSLGQYNFERNNQGYVIISNEGTKGHVIADAVVFVPVEKLASRERERPESGTPPTNSTARADANKLKTLEEQLKQLVANGPKRDMTMSVREEKQIEDARVHIRGNVHSLGESAPRSFLQVASLGSTPLMPDRESGRRQLAAWLASSENPLTARVLANRVWHWLFGAGVVRTTDNFGTTGELPSHPELLDYLAVRLVENGWSVKKLVREIVLSHTYRQSVQADARKQSADPENRLLAHANRRRLDAECIYDTILTVSGRLQSNMNGPSYRAGLNSDYGYRHSDARRAVYAPVFRNALPELFEAFDFADPSVVTGRRNVSTVAPQALFLMNHQFVLENARQAAHRLLTDPATNASSRIDRAYRLALGRPASEGERRAIEKYLNAAGNGDLEQQNAWAHVFQVLFASTDFRYVN
jgi:hypothetical protein